MASSTAGPDFVGDFDGALGGALAALVKATKAAGRLPEDIGFHRTVDDAVDQRLAGVGGAVLAMGNALWRAGAAGTGAGAGPAVESVDDVAERGGDGAWAAGPGFRAVVDAVDALLERIDVGLDEALKTTAHRMRALAARQSAPVVTTVVGQRESVRVVHAQNIARPQLQFADAVDNSAATPFAWKIRDKAHARVPLDHGLPAADVAASPLGHHLQRLGVAPGAGDGAPLRALPHPYEFEITHIEHPPRLFEDAAAREPAAWDAVPFAFVDDAAGLRAMMEHLQAADEIAIDLEHHDYRSFQGFTCLVQISTRARDYVVDALVLRAELQCLNHVTADPRRVKVFHGADHDIQWLQRDFGVYVVGLFDTYHASKVLNMAHHSLAHLLKTYCGYHADKKYQLADWRIRPVPDEMMRYARADTHFLLYVYDRMRNELLDRGRRLVGASVGSPDSAHFGELAGLDAVTSATQPMELVLQRSAATSLRTYAKDGYDADSGGGPGGWARLLAKWRHPLAPAQLAVFRALHQWRDSRAREEDESVRYVLPNHMLFALADRMPQDEPRLLAACRPTPPLVRLHAAEIVALIARARAAAAQAHADAAAAAATAAAADDDLSRRRPVHTRFADSDSDNSSDAAAAATRRPDVLTPELLAAAAALAAPASTLFAAAEAEAQPAADTVTAARAREIRAGLALTVAAPQSVVTDPGFVPVEAKKRPAAGSATPPAEAKKRHTTTTTEAKRLPAAPVILSAGPPADSNSKSHPDGSSALDLSKMVLTSPRQPSKRTKKGKKSAHQAPDVKPFDYAEPAATEDVIGETATPAAAAPARKRAKKSFDPYAKIDTSATGGKVSRSRVSTKSGNRSVSYKK
ncbi:exosome nuclease subunit [Coemansia javaensis]|uniref:Exosome nuclease subunit n=1 Tax=Coemansia javaensis TaxID=2761396 RepID=A0A9W8LI47_9FUNG|nr:exosome nuclease subunit [Coemansia javaensis]